MLTNAATHQQREGKEVTDGDGEINVINAQTSKKKSALKMFYEREKKTFSDFVKPQNRKKLHMAPLILTWLNKTMVLKTVE